MNAVIIELRQYELVPGGRATLVELFEREFVEPQVAVGVDLIGTFEDLDGPDRFVWMRGFPDPESRVAALRAFYFGPVWKQHAAAANATMIDSDNVLQLRHAGTGPRFPPPVDSAAPRAGADPPPLIAVTVYPGTAALDARLAADTRTVAVLRTDPSGNGFPQLPVRDEQVLVWIRRFADPDAYTPGPGAPLQELRLRPTRRSRLR